MKQVSVIRHTYSKSERSRIHDLSNFTLSPYLTKEDEIKKLNLLINIEPEIDKSKVNELFIFLEEIKSRIKEKQTDFLNLLGSMPDSNINNSIIQNPKKFLEHLIDNYSFQLRNIDEIISILIIETEEDETEKYLDEEN